MGNSNPALVMGGSASILSRRAICAVIALAAKVQVAGRLDNLLAILAMVIVSLYRVTLSRWLGNQCLFYPSCSQRAMDSLRNAGWTQGVAEIDAQLHRCTGDFLIRLNEAGRLELETVDGLTLCQEELSTFVVCQYSPSALHRIVQSRKTG
ncbi:MAG: membrane protein insertion efficiency factor YidD [Kiloniellaceae bacterium]